MLTKCDEPQRSDVASAASLCSALTGAGMDDVRLQLRDAVLTCTTGEEPVVAVTAARCRESLRSAATCLAAAADLVRAGSGEELVAMELRAALDQIGRVVGAVYTEDILDRVFSQFCIGK